MSTRNDNRRAWRETHREEQRAKNNAYNAANRDKARACNARQYAKDPEYHSKRQTTARRENVQLRLTHRLRERFRKAVKRSSKLGSAVRDLGCTIEAFKLYLEGLFLPGMSWANWGSAAQQWNIDHVKPLARFDLTDRDQLLEACHYTNLQPLWSLDNKSKGASYGC